ncbi:MAG: hypothetical protein LBF68_02005 [Christensenellaceae bacterium]|nr:hypothetical protein [Christensenellaceae bacterium]
MSIIIDSVIISAGALFVLYSWSLYITKSIALAWLLSIFIYVLIVIIFVKTRKIIKISKHIDSYEMLRRLVLTGNNEIINKLSKRLINKVESLTRDGQFLLIKNNAKSFLIMSNFKFGSTNEEDIARVYRKAKENYITKILILSFRTERRVISFAYSLNVIFVFPHKNDIRKYFLRHNIMPEEIKQCKNKFHQSINLKDIITNMLNPKLTYKYFLSFLILYTMSHFTFLRLYYLILSTIPLLLSIVSLILKFYNRNSIR